MKKIAILILLLLTMLIPITAAASEFRSAVNRALNTLLGTGYVPAAADDIVESMDVQLLDLLGEEYTKRDLRIVITVPVNIDNFDRTNTLARQMAEEVANKLKDKGYRVFEIRRARDIEITPRKGEFLLSREQHKLFKTALGIELVMTGTYTITDRSVRFNCRLLYTGSYEIIASGNGTVPVYNEIQPLLDEIPEEEKIPPVLAPSVRTKL